MTRLLFRAIDFGASFVFVALCAKAFCVHFYKDIKQQLNKVPALGGGSTVSADFRYPIVPPEALPKVKPPVMRR
jgi:hypothetical protein